MERPGRWIVQVKYNYVEKELSLSSLQWILFWLLTSCLSSNSKFHQYKWIGLLLKRRESSLTWPNVINVPQIRVLNSQRRYHHCWTWNHAKTLTLRALVIAIVITIRPRTQTSIVIHVFFSLQSQIIHRHDLISDFSPTPPSVTTTFTYSGTIAIS